MFVFLHPTLSFLTLSLYLFIYLFLSWWQYLAPMELHGSPKRSLLTVLIKRWSALREELVMSPQALVNVFVATLGLLVNEVSSSLSSPLTYPPLPQTSVPTLALEEASVIQCVTSLSTVVLAWSTPIGMV
jgi:hypothetical protein